MTCSVILRTVIHAMARFVNAAKEDMCSSQTRVIAALLNSFPVHHAMVRKDVSHVSAESMGSFVNTAATHVCTVYVTLILVHAQKIV